jgi:hypothetical protein
MRRSGLLLSMLLLASGFAGATSDIRVSYLADLKTLKSGAPAGTPLTFQLFTDSACTTAVSSEVVNVETLTLLQQVKAVAVSGGAKAPKPVELRHVISGVTAQPLFYLKVTGSGVSPIGGACQLQNASVNGSDAVVPPPPPPATCGPDSVSVGSGAPCVDKYEASLWDIPAGNTTLIQKVKDGTATLADLTGGGATEISVALTCSPGFPPTFPADGHYTAPLYAVSIPGVLPTACVTAYQAQVACQASGKRLLTSDEWLAAAAGTPSNVPTDDCTMTCNTNAPSGGCGYTPTNTGSRSGCSSSDGIYDAVGNVWEWTLDRTNDILTGVPSVQTWFRGGSGDYGSDAAVSSALQFDPSFGDFGFGFRCGR